MGIPKLALLCIISCTAVGLFFLPRVVYLSTYYRAYFAFPLRDVNSETSNIESPPIPFYLYDEPEFKIFDRCDGSKKGKANDALIFDSLDNHPWRVTDPSKAVLFIVPIPAFLLAHRRCDGLNATHVDAAVEAVKNSPHYKANDGWDHLIIALHYSFLKYKMFSTLRELAANFTSARISYDSPARCMVLTPFTTFVAPEDQRERSVEDYLSKRPYTLFFQGQTWPNPGYKIRRKAFEALPGFRSPNIIISTADGAKRDNPQLSNCSAEDIKAIDAPVDPLNPPLKGAEGCKDSSTATWQLYASRMLKAKFNLFFRGDTVTSSHLYDSLMQRTLSIIFSDNWLGSGSPFQCKVPWRKMLFWGSEANFRKDPLKEINRIFDGITVETMQERLSAIDEHRADLLWQVPNSRVASNVIFDAARRCVPKKLLEAKGLLRSDLKCRFPDDNNV